MAIPAIAPGDIPSFDGEVMGPSVEVSIGVDTGVEVVEEGRSVLWKLSWIMGAKMVNLERERELTGSVLVTTGLEADMEPVTQLRVEIVVEVTTNLQVWPL